MSVFWTPDKIDVLKSYLKAGFTNRIIANKMGSTVDAVSNAIRRYELNTFKLIKPVTAEIIKALPMTELDEVNFEDLKEAAKLTWNIKKSNIKSKKNVYKTMLVTSDQHIPLHDETSIKAILNLMSDIPFDINVILGDFLDYGCISHWTENKRKSLEMKRLKTDYITGNAILDEYDKRLPKNCEKHFFEGNHEIWIYDLLEKMPQLEGLIEPASQLFLQERGYKIYPYNEVIPFGKLYLTHGIYAGGNPVKKHLDELKVNVMFGHTHTISSMLSSSAAREIAFSGYNIGCLCNMAPDYMRGRPHGWSHGFAVVYLYKDGSFEVNLIRILNGQFIYNGKIYNGK